MEEDTNVKAAPVSRLRRRLSTELQDEVKSPSTPSTPNKKRIGRLAAKPQLELIDENSSDNTPRKVSKKNTTKDLPENEERPITPARRSTRIKSNTSIISDTPVNIDSPRARRAARRTSQIGSDSEAPNTPSVKHTRRTRRDSTSSIDKQEPATPMTTIIGESIAEDMESNSQNSKDIDSNDTTLNKSVRKSPRLKAKRNSSRTEDDSIEDTQKQQLNATEAEKSLDANNLHGPESPLNVSKNKKKSTTDKTQRLSKSSYTLIENLETKQTGHRLKINKSTSSIEDLNNLNKRHRTKSLSSINQNFENENIFYSDNEQSRKKKARNIEKPVTSDKKIDSSACNDNNFLNASVQDENNHSKLTADIKENKKYLVQNTNQEALMLNYSKEENKEHIRNQSPNLVETSQILAKPLIPEVKSVIYFDDSDSNSTGKNTKQFDNEDQCVPVVVNNFAIEKPSQANIEGTNIDVCLPSKTNEKPSFNNSCEPMDIDETIVSNVSVSHNKTEDCKQQNSKSEVYSSQDLNTNKSVNQSKREFISSLSVSQNGQNADKENKSTLILSQLNDVSKTQNSLSKSPKSTSNEILSNSANNDMNIEKEIDKNNISLDYETSTPLQKKGFKKLGIHINTSIINHSKCETKTDAPRKVQMSIVTDKSKDFSEEFTSEHDSSKEISNMINGEAEEASEDYASGDSQDEDEKQLELENEIVEKGETLTSDDNEFSDDSDYEKDSFIVSSDEKDNELLSGSGDDLSMSDNELSMNKKSKKKYDERKMKEQKKASREMFEARHNQSNNIPKSPITKKVKKKRLRLESTLDSEEEVITGSKKSKRLRLDSSQNCSIMQPDSHDAKKTNENKRSSISSSSDGIREHEITTTSNVSTLQKIDPLLTHVKLEPQTPLKELNITCVPIIDDIEEIQVNKNVSEMKTNETSDPLQESSEESVASTISENVEISANYDALLKVLTNEMGDRKIKSLDMSLNLNDKNKPKHKATIIEQLNLTETNTSKKNKASKSKMSDNNNIKTQNKNNFDSSSDSIHLQLLFSDDSVGSVQKVSETKQDSFIHLNSSEVKAKTVNTEEDISVSMFIDTKGNKSDTNMSINNSAKKKKKKTISVNDGPAEANDNVNTENDNSLSIFIDTKGDRSDTDMSINNSARKKKKKSLFINHGPAEDNDKVNTEMDNNVSMVIDTKSNRSDTDVSVNNSTKKKKKKFISINDGSTEAHNNVNTEEDNSVSMFIDTKGNRSDTDMSINNSAKKKKKKSISINHGAAEANDNVNTEEDNSVSMFIDTKGNRSDTDVSINNSAKKKKKKSISINDGPAEADAKVNTEMDNNVSLVIGIKGNRSDTDVSINNSAKKKKRKSISINDGPAEANDNVNTEVDKTVAMFTDIKKSNRSDADVSINNSAKKKKKKTICINDGIAEANDNVNTERDDNVKMFIDTEGNRNDISMSSNPNSKKKKKKFLSINDEPVQANDNDNPERDNCSTMFIDTKGNRSDADISLNTSGKKKKKKTTPSEASYHANNNYGGLMSIDTEGEQLDLADPDASLSSSTKKKGNKKKRPSVSEPGTDQLQISNTSKPMNESISISNGKKQKISETNNTVIESQGAVTKKHNKKRKRDDDGIEKAAKLFKQGSPDKIGIPRLSTAFLNQLDDKPNNETLVAKKSRVMSTTQFIVENTRKRRNKPSNYLEESVYLNDSHEEKKQKVHIKIPKVLPFVPTASTSGSGFTTQFIINIIPKETKFVAQTSNMTGFKNEYLRGKKIKRMSTYELYKTQRNAKLSKF